MESFAFALKQCCILLSSTNTHNAIFNFDDHKDKYSFQLRMFTPNWNLSTLVIKLKTNQQKPGTIYKTNFFN